LSKLGQANTAVDDALRRGAIVTASNRLIFTGSTATSGSG
jgi:hypothetical protein